MSASAEKNGKRLAAYDDEALIVAHDSGNRDHRVSGASEDFVLAHETELSPQQTNHLVWAFIHGPVRFSMQSLKTVRPGAELCGMQSRCVAESLILISSYKHRRHPHRPEITAETHRPVPIQRGCQGSVLLKTAYQHASRG